jgi:hypothetical protein
MDTQLVKERRRHTRHAALEGAIVALKPRAEILGQMVDIGPGGLSFRYIDAAEEDQLNGELMILVSRPHLYIESIPYRTVADFELTYEFSFSSIPVRRRCVAFGPLSKEQHAGLEELILYFTLIKPQLNSMREALDRCEFQPQSA